MLQVAPLRGQEIKPPPRAAEAPAGPEAGGYFGTLQQPGQAPAPKLYALLAAAVSPRSRASTALVMAAMEAGAQWLRLLSTRQAYAEHSCPVALEEAAGLEGALTTGPGAALEIKAEERELTALATLLTSSASAALKAAQSDSWGSEGSESACLVLDAALSSVHLLQRWGAEDELRTFLQARLLPSCSLFWRCCNALPLVQSTYTSSVCVFLQLCLKQASAAEASAASSRARQACLRTLCNPEFAEWRRLGAVLPAAAALELQLGPGDAIAPTPSKRSTRASKASEAGPAPQQLILDSQGLRKGCAALVALAASLGEAPPAVGASTRKRKAPAAGAAGDASCVTGLLRVLGHMPLGHLPEAEAARLAAAAGSAMVSSVTAALQALLAADQVRGEVADICPSF